MIKRTGCKNKNCHRQEPWTLEEYLKFSEAIQDDAQLHCACQVLFWCGLRIGELLSMTKGNVDLENGILHVLDSDVTTQLSQEIARSKNGRRSIHMPEVLTEELTQYLGSMEGLSPQDRIFTCAITDLRKAISTGAKKAGIDKVSIHSLRSSHIKLLMTTGIARSMKEIAERLGTTVLLPPEEDNSSEPCDDALIAEKLNQIMKGEC